MKHHNIMRIMISALFLLSFISASALGKRETKTVKVGDTFTVYSSGHTRLQSVLWRWDTGSLELVGSLYGTSTSATFKAKKATPASGVVIQATVYYYTSAGSTITGKFFDDWTIYVEDNTTVSLNTNRKDNLTPGDSFTLTASTSPSSYTGSYKWSSSNPEVAYISGSGNSVNVYTRSAGQTTIRVTLDNEKYAECEVQVTDNSTVSLDETSRDLYTGQSFSLTANTNPSSYSGSFTWTSNDNSVASCSGQGSTATVYAKSQGNAVIKVTLSNGNSARCNIQVSDVAVESATVSDVKLEVEKETTLKADVAPYNATVKTTSWKISEGEDIISLSSSGNLTGKKPGTASIYCTINNSVRSNNARVTVYAPDFTVVSTSPKSDAGEVSVFTSPYVTFSHPASEGANFKAITLKGEEGTVDGTVNLSGKELRFTPEKPLKPLSQYILFIPNDAVTNKWGNGFANDLSLSFKTGAYEKIKLSIHPDPGSVLTSIDSISLIPTPGDAYVYYTIDGSTPTLTSNRYVKPFTIDGDITVKAFAVREGYEDSEVVTGQYHKSQSEIIGYYPNDANPLFNYSLAVPHVRLSGSVTKSNNFRRISLTDGDGNTIPGEALLTDYLISFVPEQPLENAKTYTLDIPRDAVKTLNGEVFKGFKWSFKTPTLVTGIAMQGDNSVYTLSENGVLKMRGMEYVSPKPEDASFSFKDHESLSSILTGVDDIACGYTHCLVKKGSSLTGSGMAFCGETGDASSVSSTGGVKTFKAGFQTSAIIGEDNSLWMCGRNDFHQLGDNTGTTSKAFIKIADNVLDVALGNGYTLFIDSDNVLWGIGRNHRGQLGDSTIQDRKQPVRIMEGVAKAYASASGFFSACITTGNQLYTWGDNASGQLGRKETDYSAIPVSVLESVTSASLGASHILAVTDDYKLYSWGSNAYGQIAEGSGNVEKPAVMEDNIKMAAAGPNTSLILSNSGRVTGWGHKAHQNFGSGEGNACRFIVEEGIACDPIESVSVSPSRFETLPDSRFALIAVPSPYSADYESVEWISDNPEIAAVEGNGIIYTGNLGEATVTVRFTDRFGVSKEAEAKIVCTDNPDNSGVSEIYDESNGWTIHTEGNMLIVENATVGQTYTLFNLQGMAIDKKDAINEQVEFQVNQPGIYLVKSGTNTVKAIVR